MVMEMSARRMRKGNLDFHEVYQDEHLSVMTSFYASPFATCKFIGQYAYRAPEKLKSNQAQSLLDTIKLIIVRLMVLYLIINILSTLRTK